MDLTNVYRWCDDNGGGLVYATSIEEATAKIKAYLKDMWDDRSGYGLKVWQMSNDSYFCKEHPDVLDIY